MARPLPPDFEDALTAAPAARETFWALPPEEVEDWVGWVEEARLPRTRRKRIAEAVRQLGRARRPAAATAVSAETVVLAPNGDGPPAPLPPRAPYGLWALAILLVLFVAGLIYFLAVRNNDSGSKPTPAAVAATSTVPKVVGLREPAARFQLRQKKLATTVVRVPAAQAAGVVVGQKPAAGKSVPAGTAVTLVVSNGPAAVTLPSVVGLPAGAASKRLRAAGLATTVKQVASSETPGTVVAQKPAAGAHLKAGTAVVLTVSKRSVVVPDVSGRTAQAATAALRQAGLTTTLVQVPSSQQTGTVIAQSPAAGQKAARGSSVRLNVSKGSAAQQTPTTTQQTTTSGAVSSLPVAPPQGSGDDYRGLQVERAVQQIADGRQQAIVQYVASTKPAGTVVSNGTVGSKMRLSVSAGARPGAPTSVPDVSGEDAPQAQNDLESAGFTVVSVQWPVSDASSDGAVVYETPPGTGTAPKGAAIVLYVGAVSSP